MVFSVGDLRGTDLSGLDAQISLNKGVLDKAKIWADVVLDYGRLPFWEGAAADAARLKFTGFNKDFRYVIAIEELIYRGLVQFREGISKVKEQFSNLEKECSANSFEITDSSVVIDLKNISYNIPVGGSISLEEELALEKEISERKEKQQELQKRLESILLVADDVNHDAYRDFSDAAAGRINLDKVKTVKAAIAKADKQAKFDAVELPNELRANPIAAGTWWNSLTKSEQNRLLHDHPEQLVTLDGIPFTGGARSEACLRYLPKAREELEKEKARLAELNKHSSEVSVKEYNKQQIKIINDKIDGLNRIDSSVSKKYGVKSVEGIFNNSGNLAAYNSGDGFSLVSLDTHSSNQLLAAGVQGNLDKADRIAVSVGGVTTNVKDRWDEKVRDNKLLDNTMENIIRTSPNGNRSESVATVAWLGYEAPDTTNKPVLGIPFSDPGTFTSHMAQTGSDKLSSFLTGVDTVNHPEHGALKDSNITLIGHSYGSTTSDLAAMKTKDGVVDNLVLQGSPGTVSDAASLHVPEGHRFIEKANNDYVANQTGADVSLPFTDKHLHGLGNDNPYYRDDFTRLETGGLDKGDDRLAGKVAANYDEGLFHSNAHSEYSRPVGNDSEGVNNVGNETKLHTSVYNTAAVAAGRTDQTIVESQVPDHGLWYKVSHPVTNFMDGFEKMVNPGNYRQ